jgi:hypothetical protein
MAGTRKPLLSWNQLSKGQAVTFYTADGWKKGAVTSVNHNSVSVFSFIGSKPKTTTIYDLRNIRPA